MALDLVVLSGFLDVDDLEALHAAAPRHTAFGVQTLGGPEFGPWLRLRARSRRAAAQRDVQALAEAARAGQRFARSLARRVHGDDSGNGVRAILLETLTPPHAVLLTSPRSLADALSPRAPARRPRWPTQATRAGPP